MQFYAKCLGAELQMMKFGDMPGGCPEGVKAAKDRIMHARLTRGAAVLMASDNMPDMPFQQGTTSPSLSSAKVLRKSTGVLPPSGKKEKLPCLYRRHSGLRGLACSPINSASIGCSTSKKPRRNSCKPNKSRPESGARFLHWKIARAGHLCHPATASTLVKSISNRIFPVRISQTHL